MKTNGAKHPKLKELFFPERAELDEGELPTRVARLTSIYWLAHIFMSEVNKHWKYVNFAVKHGTKMTAPFFYSQAEKKAQKDVKDAKLKAARAKNLLETKDERAKKHAELLATAKRQKTNRAKV